jgi:hypothetical protein
MEKMNAFVEEELVNHEGVVEEIVDQNENENFGGCWGGNTQ